MKNLFALLFSFALFAGCSDFFGETKTIRLYGPAPFTTSDQEIIAARLRAHTTTLFPSFRFRNENDGITILARGMPTEAKLQFLLLHRGAFAVKPRYGRIWFTQADIIDAAAGVDGPQASLNFKLSAQAAARVAKLSVDNIGTNLSVVFDDEVLATPKIIAEIGSDAQLSVNKSIEEVLMISTILKTGALSSPVTSIKIE